MLRCSLVIKYFNIKMYADVTKKRNSRNKEHCGVSIDMFAPPALRNMVPRTIEDVTPTHANHFSIN